MYLRAFVLGAVCLGFVVLSGPASSTVVTFPDVNLEAAVRNALNKPDGDILDTDMATLTSLFAVSAGISDLGGLEYAVNLTSLTLEQNAITDLTPLSGLNALETLRLIGNSIADLNPISGLTNLTGITLGDNPIADFSPIGNLTDLVNLNLASTGFTDADMGHLIGLSGLADLVLVGNDVTSVGVLILNAGIGAGDFLDLRQNTLSSFSLCVEIPELQARGVTVLFDGSCPPDGEVEGEQIVVQEGARLELGISEPVDDFMPIQWTKSGVPLSDSRRITGSNSDTLVIDPVIASDGGFYGATYDDGSKASAVYGPVYVVVEGVGMAVGGAAGAGLLAMIIVVLTVRMLRRIHYREK